MVNPFSVTPLGGLNLAPGVAGAVGAFRERGAERQRQQKLQEASQLMDSGDTDAMASFMLENPELAQQVQGAMGFRNEQTRQNMADSAFRFLTGQGTAEDVARERASFVTQQGGDPSDTMAWLQADPEAQTQQAEMALLYSNPQLYQQYKQATATPEEKGVVVGPGEVLVGGRTGREIARGGEKPDETLKDIRKEVRSSVGTELKNIKKEVSTVKTNFNKLKNLSDEIEKGNRTAVSQGLVALVKLGDPTSVVKDSEMINALNTENPVAAVAGMLQGKNVSEDVISSVTRRIDPLNPDNVDINDLLSTAQALITANTEGIRDRFSAAESRAQSNLTQEGIRSLFDDPTRKALADLDELRAEKRDSSAQTQRIDELRAKLGL